MPFAPHYELHGKYLQRLSSEMRVPHFQGFIMPTNAKNSETASYYKQLITRPLAVAPGDTPAKQRVLESFSRFAQSSPGNSPNHTMVMGLIRRWTGLTMASPSTGSSS